MRRNLLLRPALLRPKAVHRQEGQRAAILVRASRPPHRLWSHRHRARPTPAASSRAILEQELANERKALASAQQSLSNARSAKGGAINQELVNQLQGSVLDRQQNIQALQRELGRM